MIQAQVKWVGNSQAVFTQILSQQAIETWLPNCETQNAVRLSGK